MADPTHNLNGGFKPTLKRFADWSGLFFQRALQQIHNARALRGFHKWTDTEIMLVFAEGRASQKRRNNSDECAVPQHLWGIP
jgi:hypothetical protein